MFLIFLFSVILAFGAFNYLCLVGKIIVSKIHYDPLHDNTLNFALFINICKELAKTKKGGKNNKTHLTAGRRRVFWGVGGFGLGHIWRRCGQEGRLEKITSSLGLFSWATTLNSAYI